MFLMILASIISLTLDYEKVSFRTLLTNGYKYYYFERKHKILKSMSEYIPELKYVIKNYSLLIIVTSLFWAISTVVSQQAIDFSKQNFNMLSSKASFILLYSAI